MIFDYSLSFGIKSMVLLDLYSVAKYLRPGLDKVPMDPGGSLKMMLCAAKPSAIQLTSQPKISWSS